MLCSNSVQEAMDSALIAHAATLEARIPFIHFFDGFRTSAEVMKIERLDESDIRAMIDDELVRAHKARALSPDHPVMRGTAQNPDVFFQAREACNPFYEACPSIVRRTMARFAELTGRSYGLFDYAGHPEAERVIVMMGSGAEVAHETVEDLVARGEKVGLVKVRLYRPFDNKALLAALPKSVKKIAPLASMTLDKAHTYVSGPLTADTSGSVYYNVLALADPAVSDPWFGADAMGAWLVKVSTAESDRHRRKSQSLSYAMLVAQVGAVAASLALSRKKGYSLWFVAGVIGIVAVGFGGYAFLPMIPAF